MDEAYKILPKKQHFYWNKFKTIHSEKIVNYIRSILGDIVLENDFVNIYLKLTSMKSSPSDKKKGAKYIYKYIKKSNWIK